MENMKRFNFNIKTMGIIIAAALIILVFFSRTIYSYNLPVVTATMPERGSLSKIEQTSGIVSFAREYDIYSDMAGKIEELFVMEGDAVKAGDPLIRMDFGEAVDKVSAELEKSVKDTESKLEENEISAYKAAVDIAKLELNISNTNQKISQLKKESYTADFISDYELKVCMTDLEKAEENYSNTKILFDAGAASLKELTESERAIEILKDKLSYLSSNYNEQLQKSKQQLSDKEESRSKQITDLEHQLRAYAKDLEAKRLDLQNISTQKEKINADSNYNGQELTNSIKDFEDNLIIRAKKDSVIMELNVREGQYTGVNQKLLSCGIPASFIVECRVPLDNNFIAAGDECALSNTSHSVTGYVARVKTLENAKLVTVSFEGEDISPGETFDIKFERTSSTTYTLVPRAALNMDNDGYYLSQIKRRNGILGKEFYSEKLRVYIGDSDNDNVAIIKGISFPEPVALISDKPFTDGETIKIKNESDFFEN